MAQFVRSLSAVGKATGYEQTKGTFRIVVAKFGNMALEDTRDGDISSRRYKLCAKFLVSALYAALGNVGSSNRHLGRLEGFGVTPVQGHIARMESRS